MNEGERANLRVDRDNVLEPGTIILKSSGTTPKYFKLNVSDTGTLSTTEVTTIDGIPCPPETQTPKGTMFGLFERNIPQTATQTQTSTIDEGMRGFRDGLFDYANQNILDKGFQGYGGDRFSGFNQDQMNAFQAVRDQQGMGSGSYQGAIDASQRVANMSSPSTPIPVVPEHGGPLGVHEPVHTKRDQPRRPEGPG